MRHAHARRIRTHRMVVVLEQIALFVCRFLVVEGLIMWQSGCGIKHVNDAVHCVVHKALHLEIACTRESYCESCALDRWWRGHTGRAIEACGAIEKWRPRRDGATHSERWKGLSNHQKRYGVNFVRVEGPGNAVAGMNPNFVRKKSQRLPAHIRGLAPTFACQFC